MTLETWLLFCSASVLVILIPGPLSLLMISNSINHGLLRSTPAFIGGVSASLILLTASATGLGALLLASESLFNLIRYAGAAYMLYLGYRAWQDSRQVEASEKDTSAPGPNVSSMFWRAFTLGISNPKDILFFVAFLPQFISLETSLPSQLLVMIVSWCLLDLACKLFYGCSAKLLAPALSKTRNLRTFNRVSAGIFVSAGTAVLLK
ncbi:LysE family translocator [Neptunomonas antarctica]|uniref:Threonine/homoserine/homoserine lactone efflux protein n=1 Tax=Neptunomonas antarctica TaxID=619304 RepID=A0A1N7L9G3_9GAMM|nr:LysE family translocator [Neptunomonas antarctica]SIS70423.1 Threonine/homoserine/homoserine lactone efflux protein [Neptunomonas antarctica]